jgi:transcriptional regulator with XRE-family HTH domain
MDKGQALKDLGKMIRTARENAGITQLNLGYKLGFKSGQFISSLERGKRTVPFRHIAPIAHTLGIEQSVIVDGMIQIEKLRLTMGLVQWLQISRTTAGTVAQQSEACLSETGC